MTTFASLLRFLERQRAEARFWLRALIKGTRQRASTMSAPACHESEDHMAEQGVEKYRAVRGQIEHESTLVGSGLDG
jgi:hypothetical protein